MSGTVEKSPSLPCLTGSEAAQHLEGSIPPVCRSKSPAKRGKADIEAQAPKAPGRGKQAQQGPAAVKMQRQQKAAAVQSKSASRSSKRRKPGAQPGQEDKAQGRAESRSAAGTSSKADLFGGGEDLQPDAPQHPATLGSGQEAAALTEEESPLRQETVASPCGQDSAGAVAGDCADSLAVQAEEEDSSERGAAPDMNASDGTIPGRWQEANR